MSGTRLLRHFDHTKIDRHASNVEFAIGHDQSSMLEALSQEPGFKSGRAPQGPAGVNQAARFAASWPFTGFHPRVCGRRPARSAC